MCIEYIANVSPKVKKPNKAILPPDYENFSAQNIKKLWNIDTPDTKHRFIRSLAGKFRF
jgi:hypothetical protein